MADRAMVNVYELVDGVEQLVYREMNDAELAQSQLDSQEVAAQQQALQDAGWVSLRMKRDRWLAQTDSFFVSPLPSDFPADKASMISANETAWVAFRQALRDLPANTTDPFEVVWPAPPGAPVVYLT
jgi:hypothetical protein